MRRPPPLRAGLPYLPAGLALIVVARLVSPLNDRFQFWFAGHLVASGRSPYDQSAWAGAAANYGDAAALVARNCPDALASACLWAYPPWTAWLFAPFGLLDADRGMTAIAAFLLIAGAVSTVLLARAAQLMPRSRMVVALMAVASAPFVWDSFLGHFEPLLLIGAVLIASGLRDRRAALLSAGAILLMLKPNLIGGLVPLVAGLLVARHAWRPMGVTLGALGLLVVAGFGIEPAAPQALLGAGAKTLIVLPTTWSFATRVAPSASIVVDVAVITASVAAAWIAVRSAPQSLADLTLVAVGLALSLAVTPYDHLYDDLLLLPAVACGIAVLDARGERARMFGWVVFGFGFVAATWLAFLAGPHGDEPAEAALIPVTALIALGATMAWTRRAGRGHHAGGGRR